MKWFLTPLYPQHPLPQVVRNCHALVSELFSPSLDQKLEECTEWLQTEMDPKEKPHPKQPVATPPKVINYDFIYSWLKLFVENSLNVQTTRKALYYIRAPIGVIRKLRNTLAGQRQ